MSLVARFADLAVFLVAAGLQDWVDFGVICGLLLLNAAVGFIQEFQAGSIVDELKKLVLPVSSSANPCANCSLQDPRSQGCCPP